MEITIVCVFEGTDSNLLECHGRLESELQQMGGRYKFLYVDNRADPQTADQLERLAVTHSDVQVLRLAQRVSKSGALTAGLNHSASGATIVLSGLDTDLGVLQTLVENWEAGFEIVWALPTLENNSPTLGHKIARYLSARLAFKHLELFSAALFDARVLQIFRSLPHREEDVTSTLASYGFRQAFPVVAASTRTAHTGTEALKGLARKLITSSMLPVRLVSGVGLALGICGILYSLLIVGDRMFFSLGEVGWPSLAIVILFLGSAQMVALGITVEYVWRNFQQCRQTPRYIISDCVGTPQRRPEADWIVDVNDVDVSRARRPHVRSSPKSYT